MGTQPTYIAMDVIRGTLQCYLDLNERDGYFTYQIPEPIHARMVDLVECIERIGADKPQGAVLDISASILMRDAL